MKKIFLLIVLLSTSYYGIQAQNFGIKGGYALSTLNGETVNNSNVKSKSGFYLGAFLEFSLGGIVGLQPEIIYSKQGAMWEYSNLLGKDVSTKLNMDYINVPVMAKLGFGGFSLVAGPQFGFMISKPTIAYSYSGSEISTKIDKDAFASFDFGLGVGAELFINNFLIEARYTHGLINTFDKNNSSLKSANISDKNDFKNAVLTLGIGFKF